MIRFFKQYFLIFLGVILDVIVLGLLPSVFGYESFIVTPYFAITGLLISTKNFTLQKKLIAGLIYGVLWEITLYDTSLIPLLSLLSIIVIGHRVHSIFSGSYVERGILHFFELSLMKIISFFYATILQKISIPFISFFTYEFILTMLLNTGVIIFMLLIDAYLVDQRFRDERWDSQYRHY